MSAELKIEEEWQVATVAVAQNITLQERRWQKWRKQLVSLWEAVWFVMWGARVMRFNEVTQRYEEVNLGEWHRTGVTMKERIW